VHVHDRAGAGALVQVVDGTDTPCPACGSRGGMRPDVVWFGEMPLHLDAIEGVRGREVDLVGRDAVRPRPRDEAGRRIDRARGADLSGLRIPRRDAAGRGVVRRDAAAPRRDRGGAGGSKTPAVSEGARLISWVAMPFARARATKPAAG
jgi:hypothetical protein